MKEEIEQYKAEERKKTCLNGNNSILYEPTAYKATSNVIVFYGTE